MFSPLAHTRNSRPFVGIDEWFALCFPLFAIHSYALLTGSFLGNFTESQKNAHCRVTFSKNTRNRSGNLRRSVTRPIKLHAIFKLATRTIIVDRSNRGSLVCLRTSARTTCRCPCACEPMSQTQNKNNRNWHKQTNEFGLRKHEIRIRVEWRWGNRSADFIYMLLFIRRAFGKCSRACDPLLAAKRFSN